MVAVPWHCQIAKSDNAILFHAQDECKSFCVGGMKLLNDSGVSTHPPDFHLSNDNPGAKDEYIPHRGSPSGRIDKNDHEPCQNCENDRKQAHDLYFQDC